VRGGSVEVRVLGDLEVLVQGRRVELPASKKTRALLVYLVLTRAPQLREHLCDLLWQGPDDPRGALRWSLAKLRGTVGDKSIVADRQRAAFVGDAAACDALRARADLSPGVDATATDVLESVAASFRGELLEGLDLADCFRWHEWCVSQRESLRALRVSVLAALVARHADRPETALAYARQRLAIDPITESAHVDVVRLLTGLGRNREANEQVEACRRLLAEELGTKPSSALLAARVRTEAPAPSPVAAEATVVAEPTVAAEPTTKAVVGVPFVGREAELVSLVSSWRSARSGEGPRAVLVAGEPGIGKTRLVGELSALAQSEGARVLRGRAFEAEMVRPYGPWIDALPKLGSTDSAKLADRTRLFDAVVGMLAAAAGAPGCVLTLDDLQWFDEASLALLHYVLRSTSLGSLLVACTARRAELAENVPAVRLVRALERHGALREVTLGPLDAAATAAIARAVHSGVDASRVAAESSGNPFFALELARAARDESGHTESLDALLADRLDRLDRRARDLLPWAAALGRGFKIAWLGRASEMGDSDLLGGVEELETRGILRAEGASTGGGDPAYDFSHDLLRAAAYRRLSSPRRRHVHDRIARSLAQAAATDASLHGDVVHHAALAGDHQLAAGSAVRAAERSLRMFANDEAARLAETGLAHAERLTGAARIAARVALLRIKSKSGSWFRRASELEAELSRAVAEALQAGMHAEAAEALHWLSGSQRERGDIRGAHENTLLAVEVARAGDSAARARTLVHTARCLAYLDRDIERARSLLDEAAVLLPSHEHDFEWRHALALIGSYCDAPECVSSLEASLQLSRRDEDRLGECECLIRLVQVALDRGEPAHALAWCRELAPVAAKMNEGSEGAIAEALEALARVASAVPGASDHLDRGIARLREVDAKGMLAYVLATSADLDRAAGRLAQAHQRASAALAAAEAVQRRTLVASAHASLAEVALANGDRAEAATHLEAVARDLASPLGVAERVRARLARLAAALAS
jgi:DNA-binding SARP family transcriptional activator